LSITDDLYGLQIGPDSKIYLSRSFGTSFLGVINSPDSASTLCNYVENGLDLDPGFMGVNAALTLPGFMQSYLTAATGVVCPVTTGITGHEATNDLLAYPNPSSETFSIDLSKAASPADLAIYDLTGKLIEAQSDVHSLFTFGKSYAKGVYFVQVRNGDVLKTYKVVKL